MLALSAECIAQATAGRVVFGDPAVVGANVAVDSRTVTHGSVFFALAGERSDGHAYSAQAVEAGARVLVVSREDGVAAPRTARCCRRPSDGHACCASGPGGMVPRWLAGHRGGDHRFYRQDDEQGPADRRATRPLRCRVHRRQPQQRDRAAADGLERVGLHRRASDRDGDARSRPDRPACGDSAATDRAGHQRGNKPHRTPGHPGRGRIGEGRACSGGARVRGRVPQR